MLARAMPDSTLSRRPEIVLVCGTENPKNWGSSVAAQTVLEELTGDELTREHVQERVDDWANRIEALYRDLERWLPAGWTARRGPPVVMREPLMQKTGVPERELPTLELAHDGTIEVYIRPYGLWIIGANGRLDLIKKGQELFLLVDHALTFEAPRWSIAALKARSLSESCDEKRFRALLEL